MQIKILHDHVIVPMLVKFDHTPWEWDYEYPLLRILKYTFHYEYSLQKVRNYCHYN